MYQRQEKIEKTTRNPNNSRGLLRCQQHSRNRICKKESAHFQVECTDRTAQYKHNAQSQRLFGLHRDVNDAHRAGANHLQNKKTKLQRLRMDEEKPLHHVKGLPMSLVNSAKKNFTTTMSKTNMEMKATLTSEELQDAIRKLKKGKSPDSDGIRAEDIKACDDETTEMVRKIFN